MDELDAYSRTVSTVAAAVGPSVAAVRAGRGSGSAVVVDDRLLITNAHVVDNHRSGRVAFGDATGPSTTSASSAPTRSPTSRSSPRATTANRSRPQSPSAMPPASSSASSWVAVGNPLGLAVPITGTTRRILDTLRREGRVRRRYLGVVGSPAPLPADVAARLGRRTGLRVAEVVGGSPARQAGLRAGDLVVSADREPVADAQGLQRRLCTESIGRTVPITTLRSGAMVDVLAVPTELADR